MWLTRFWVILLRKSSFFLDPIPHSSLVVHSSVVAYPIFDSLNPLTRKVSGMFSTTLYWRVYFSQILPTSARGIICVLSNNFNQTMSYLVDGPDVYYLGPSDMHDSKYDHLVQTADVNEYISNIMSKTTKSYTSVDLNNDFGRYKLHVYPSLETEMEFTNSLPVYHTIVVAGVVLFTSTVFLLYDYLVRRRQKKVMDRAVASGAIVSSLFPDKVRDQLYKQTQKVGASSQEVTSDMFQLHSKNGNIIDADVPMMADLFPNTTIMFADIAGYVSGFETQKAHIFVLDLLDGVVIDNQSRSSNCLKRKDQFQSHHFGSTSLSTGCTEHLIAWHRRETYLRYVHNFFRCCG